jgi:archaellum component FlaC
MHESLCCPLCISEDHNECVGLLAIENIVKTAKTSAMLDSIEDTLKDISSNMERVIRDREGNLTKITDQRRKIHNQIQEERKKINEHLNKLEEHVIGILDAEEAKIKSEIENLLEKLNKKAVSIEMLQSKLSALKLYASDLQTFLGGRTILLEVKEEETCVTTLLAEKCLQQVNLCYRHEEKMARSTILKSLVRYVEKQILRL